MAEQGSSGLAVDEVTVRFGGLVALDQVSMQASRGEIVGIIGPNGAGKTTLFNVICGFVRPNSGRLTFDGRLLRRQQPHDLAKLGIARTLQGVGLFAGLTAVENVVIGAQHQARAGFVSSALGGWRSTREESRLRRRALELLDELRVAGYASAYPGTLPYGVRKRVSLARALMAEPTLLLLDEPASGLSADEMAELGTLVRALRLRMGVLLVEHFMDFVMATCDRLVVLNFGQVIATGTPGDIRADPVVTTAYLGEEVQDASVADEIARGVAGDGHGGPHA